ncbi:hypothetical protein KCU95_g10121, partial [Aureobasidium melanogenum]
MNADTTSMSQDKSTQVIESWNESHSTMDLHSSPAIYDCARKSVIVPMRFKLDTAAFSTAPETISEFQDILWLPSKYRDLTEKVLKNLYCRLNKKFPGRSHWYMPWRKRHHLNVGLKVLITYQLSSRHIYPFSQVDGPGGYMNKTIEVNEANWPDVISLFRSRKPVQARVHVDWWIENEWKASQRRDLEEF